MYEGKLLMWFILIIDCNEDDEQIIMLCKVNSSRWRRGVGRVEIYILPKHLSKSLQYTRKMKEPRQDH